MTETSVPTTRTVGSLPPALTSALVLLAFLAISFGVAALGSIATFNNVDGWYADADKAQWNPPNWLFGPAWTVLYTLMSVAAWLVWRRREHANINPALSFYVAQLVLNALWTPLFFGLYPSWGPVALWLALAVILLLDGLVLLTMITFWSVSKTAAWLLVPYWAWLLFATTLNWALAAFNS